MEKNGSPLPHFETDDDRTYFLCTLPAHPLSIGEGTVLGRIIDNKYIFNSLEELDNCLRSANDLRWNQVGTEIHKALETVYLKILEYSYQPGSRTENWFFMV
jgi:hypothetical protein